MKSIGNKKNVNQFGNNQNHLPAATYYIQNELPTRLTLINGSSSSPAIACASKVLPHPGGPCKRNPRGGATPNSYKQISKRIFIFTNTHRTSLLIINTTEKILNNLL